MAVPELRKARFALATPVFFRATTPQQWRALESGTGLAPAAGRQFRPGERVRVDVESYGAGGAVELHADVLGSGGRSLVRLAVVEAVGGQHQLTLPVASLGQGTYVLRLRAREGDSEAEERVAFEIIP